MPLRLAIREATEYLPTGLQHDIASAVPRVVFRRGLSEALLARLLAKFPNAGSIALAESATTGPVLRHFARTCNLLVVLNRLDFSRSCVEF